MKNVFVRSWFAALAVLFMVSAMARAEQPQAYVVVVGVNQTKDPAIKPRTHAEDDAKAIYDFITTSKYWKTDTGHVKLLLGTKDDKRSSEAATRDNVLKSVRWALQTAKEDDLVLIFWAGQGGPLGDGTCYFATDSTFKDRVKNAVSGSELEQEFEKAKSNRICVLLDVNFKGFDAGTEKVSETGLEKRFNPFLGMKEDAEGPPKPIMFLAANDGIHPSAEVEKNGLFTNIILEALKGKGDTEGNEKDGLITVDELFEYVRKELPSRSATLTKKEQRPIGFGRSTHFVLAENPEPAPEIAKRLAKFDEIAKAGPLDKAIAKEGRDLLTRMPRFDSQRKLRKQYQELADGTVSVEDFLKKREAYVASLKLPRADAEAFADNILKIANIARDNYVKSVTLSDLVSNAVKGIFRSIDEKLPKDLEERLGKAKELDEEGLKTLLVDVREALGNRDDLKGDKAMDFSLDRMLHALDPYSTWIDPETLERFNREMQQVFIGVGIQIRPDSVRNMVRVSTPLRGGSAHKAGIQAGDLITKITNFVDKEGKKLDTPEVTSTKGLNINDVVKKILGPKGTKVKLTVEREMTDGPKELDFELNRNTVQVETVVGAKRNDDEESSWNYYVDQENKIGYIRLTQFAVNTDRDLRAAITQLQKQGLNGLVLDLRFNPGGYLDSAVKISDLFIDDGLVVTIRPRERKPIEYKGRHDGSLLNFPLVVMVNKGSASASEIVSACIQDHERGIVIGERSFGKGSVQNVMPIDMGNAKSQLKLTTASFWRPSGKNLHRFPTSKPSDDWGVSPSPGFDVTLTPSERDELEEHLKKNEVIPRRDPPKMETTPTFVDKQLDKAVEYLRSQVTAKTSLKKAD